MHSTQRPPYPSALFFLSFAPNQRHLQPHYEVNAGGDRLRSRSRWLHSDWAAVGALSGLLAIHSGAQGKEYSVQNWHLDDGLPDGDITAIQQTPDGFLWVGTPKGLALLVITMRA